MPSVEPPPVARAPAAEPLAAPVAGALETSETAPDPEPIQHPPGSLAEALARAAAMPKPKVAQAEAKKPIVNPYADIEMPDGDWG